MSLLVYRDTPPNAGTQVDLDDTYVGDGIQTTFVLVNKSVNRLAGTIMVDNTLYYQYNGGFTKTSTGFTLSVAPPIGSQIIAPGLGAVIWDSVFDSANVPGVSNSNIQDVPFYLFDITDIGTQSYSNVPAYNGIHICFVDLATSAGAQTSWVQLASSSNGSALTYGATGQCLDTAGITAFGTLLASCTTSASSLIVDTASSFYNYDYIMLNPGQLNEEIVQCISHTGTTMTISGTDFTHSIGEPVFACGRQFWARVTIPIGETSGLATSFWNLALRPRARINSRV